MLSSTSQNLNLVGIACGTAQVERLPHTKTSMKAWTNGREYIGPSPAYNWCSVKDYVHNKATTHFKSDSFLILPQNDCSQPILLQILQRLINTLDLFPIPEPHSELPQTVQLDIRHSISRATPLRNPSRANHLHNRCVFEGRRTYIELERMQSREDEIRLSTKRARKIDPKALDELAWYRAFSGFNIAVIDAEVLQCWQLGEEIDKLRVSECQVLDVQSR